MIAGSTLFVFRRREPNADRPYRVLGYPLVPATFVLVSAVLLYYTFTDNLKIRPEGAGHPRRHPRVLLLCTKTEGLQPE